MCRTPGKLAQQHALSLHGCAKAGWDDDACEKRAGPVGVTTLQFAERI